jgi:hypothetical protein
MVQLLRGERVAPRVRNAVILHVLFSPQLEKLYGMKRER